MVRKRTRLADYKRMKKSKIDPLEMLKEVKLTKEEIKAAERAAKDMIASIPEEEMQELTNTIVANLIANNRSGGNR